MKRTSFFLKQQQQKSLDLESVYSLYTFHLLFFFKKNRFCEWKSIGQDLQNYFVFQGVQADSL